jgi:hypothetical protein
MRRTHDLRTQPMSLAFSASVIDRELSAFG